MTPQIEPLKVKAVILIGGPSKGTRFRSFSMDISKPLFPIGGLPLIEHHIAAVAALSNSQSCTFAASPPLSASTSSPPITATSSSIPPILLQEILLIGFYENSPELRQFVATASSRHRVRIRYLAEFEPLGTAGGLHHFRDQILRGEPDAFFVMNSDVCCDFPLKQMLAAHSSTSDPWSNARFLILCTEASRRHANEYGCLVFEPHSRQVRHYVEKPHSFVSSTINCGVYLFTARIFPFLRDVFSEHQRTASPLSLSAPTSQSPLHDDVTQTTQTTQLRRAGEGEEGGGEEWTSRNSQQAERIDLEREILKPLCDSGNLFAFPFEGFWTQIRSAASVLFANRHCLQLFRRDNPSRLARDNNQKKGDDAIARNGGAARILGNVFIDPTAIIDCTAKIGPNVSIGPHVVIGRGVRLRDCIVVRSSRIGNHSCLAHCVIGSAVQIGAWVHVEGCPRDLDPNTPRARLEMDPIFDCGGRLNAQVAVIGSEATLHNEVSIFNSIILPQKDIRSNVKNEIIL